jgi:small-conductance mechanosensitive channel
MLLTRPTRRCCRILMGCCLLLAASTGHCDTAPTVAGSSATAPSPAGDLAARRAETTARRTRIEQQIQAAQAQRLAVPADLAAELELLKWLDLTYTQRQFWADSKQELIAEAAALRSELSALPDDSSAVSSRCSFLELDEFQDALLSEQLRSRSIDVEIEASIAILESIQQSRSECDKERRQLREALERGGQRNQASAVRQQELVELKCTTWNEAVTQREEELELHRLKKQNSDQKAAILQQRIARLRPLARFTADDLARQLASLEQVEAGLRQELALAEQRLLEADRVRTATQVANSGTDTDGNRTRDSQQELVSLLTQSLQDLCVTRLGWRRRYEAFNGQATLDKLRQWKVESERFAERAQRRREAIEQRLQDCRQELAAIRDRESAPAAATAGRSLPSTLPLVAELDQLTASYGKALLTVQAHGRFFRRFHDELTERVAPASAEQWAKLVWSYCRNCWNYEITSVDDRPITLGKVICGIVLLIVGFGLSRVGSGMVRRRVAPRLKLDEGAAAGVQTIVFYLLLSVCTVFSLELIHLPLTVFTFMGGAIAIGVGFGSQNVLSNFISGLILLAERPVRAGDVVDIDGLTGVIDTIGARSTRLRTGGNLEIIVPNSKFLESNVTNWTLSDSHVRTKVSVGAAYGSSTRTVEQLLGQIVRARPDVLPQPEPVVVFKDFGDNSLLFEAHFWIDARSPMAGEILRSEIRHTIDEVFRAHRIEIAYPQRDIHLDMQSPIQLQVRRLPEELDRPQQLRAA